MTSVLSLSCPTCGAPLPEGVRTHGSGRCLYCDVLAVYDGQIVGLETGEAPTSVARSVGWIRRYGTIALAPFLGFSACALLNLQRQFQASEEIINISLLLGLCVLGLMMLNRWVVAGLWILFISLALIMERSLAFQEVAPVSNFGFTHEVTLIPMMIVAAFWTIYLFFWFHTKDVAHEQMKFGWRTSVALAFGLGVVGGIRYHAQPYYGEVYHAWTWAYAEEMQRLTLLKPTLDDLSSRLPDTVSATIAPHWVERQPEQSNVVFMPYRGIDMFPDNQFFKLDYRETLYLTDRYRLNFERVADTVSERAYFSPVVAPANWRALLEQPLTSSWVVVYDSRPDALRVWLVERQLGAEVYGRWRDSTLVAVGYRETAWPPEGDDGGLDSERAWMVRQLAEMSGGVFTLWDPED